MRENKSGLPNSPEQFRQFEFVVNESVIFPLEQALRMPIENARSDFGLRGFLHFQADQSADSVHTTVDDFVLQYAYTAGCTIPFQRPELLALETTLAHLSQLDEALREMIMGKYRDPISPLIAEQRPLSTDTELLKTFFGGGRVLHELLQGAMNQFYGSIYNSSLVMIRQFYHLNTYPHSTKLLQPEWN